jgi:hypothetical protein
MNNGGGREAPAAAPSRASALSPDRSSVSTAALTNFGSPSLPFDENTSGNRGHDSGSSDLVSGRQRSVRHSATVSSNRRGDVDERERLAAAESTRVAAVSSTTPHNFSAMLARSTAIIASHNSSSSLESSASGASGASAKSSVSGGEKSQNFLDFSSSSSPSSSLSSPTRLRTVLVEPTLSAKDGINEGVEKPPTLQVMKLKIELSAENDSTPGIESPPVRRELYQTFLSD